MTADIPQDPTTLKRTLRSALRARRRALDERARQQAALQAAHWAHQLPPWRAGARIAAYMAEDGELDPLPLIEQALRDGLQPCLPVIQADKHLTFRHWRPGEPLRSNRYGIAEPLATAATCALQDVQILLLPLVGWDRNGGRLGMGGGYYDRTLAIHREGEANPPFLCGLGYSMQEVERLPMEAWDVRLDAVLTERGLVYTAP